MKTLNKENWKEEDIVRFWNWVSQNEMWSNNYFTKHVGLGLKRFIASKIKPRGNYLDYGCGNGHLLEYMLKLDTLNSYGLEYSPKSMELVNKKYFNRSTWKKCILVEKLPSKYKTDFFDFITFIETIEHLKDDTLQSTGKELNRLLRIGGKLMVTTPYNENLKDNYVYCPFCDSEFHRMQHMQSFSIESLKSTMEAFGFRTLFCDHLNFYKWEKLPAKFGFYKRQLYQTLGLREYAHENRPHLVGIFEKI